MNKRLLHVVGLVLLFSTFFSTSAMSQDGKRMSFQGTLYENGLPVTGERTFTFSIDLGNGSSWSETQSNVQIIEGLYAVTLGSVTPLPNNLFFEANERTLTVNIGNTALGTAPLYAPFSPKAIGAIDDLPRRIEIDNTKADSDTIFYFKITADNLTQGSQKGLQIDMTGQGFKMAIRGNTISQSGDASSKIAVLGSATGSGTGTHEGVRGQAFGVGRFNNGVVGLAGGTGNGATGLEEGSYNTGILGYGQSNPWGNSGVAGYAVGTVGVDNIGVAGISTVGEAGNVGIENKGVLGRAEGPGVNKAVWGRAINGVENWAGWFEGDVRSTTSFQAIQDVTETTPFRTTLAPASVAGHSPDEEVNFILSQNWLNGGDQIDNRGALFIFGDTLERFNRNGADIRRVDLTAADNGQGGSSGQLNLRAWDGDMFKAGIDTREDGFNSGRLNLTSSLGHDFASIGINEQNAGSIELKSLDNLTNVLIDSNGEKAGLIMLNDSLGRESIGLFAYPGNSSQIRMSAGLEDTGLTAVTGQYVGGLNPFINIIGRNPDGGATGRSQLLTSGNTPRLNLTSPNFTSLAEVSADTISGGRLRFANKLGVDFANLKMNDQEAGSLELKSKEGITNVLVDSNGEKAGLITLNDSLGRGNLTMYSQPFGGAYIGMSAGFPEVGEGELRTSYQLNGGTQRPWTNLISRNADGTTIGRILTGSALSTAPAVTITGSKNFNALAQLYADDANGGILTLADTAQGSSTTLGRGVLSMTLGDIDGNLIGSFENGVDASGNGYLRYADRSNNGYNQLIALNASIENGATLQLLGPTSRNYVFGTRSWENSDQPRMTLAGSQRLDDGNGGTYLPDIFTMEVSTYQDGSENASLTFGRVENGQLNNITLDYNMLNSLPRHGMNFINNNQAYYLGDFGSGRGNLQLYGNNQIQDANGNSYLPSLGGLNVGHNSDNNTEWGSLYLAGPTSTNFTFGGNWDNADQPRMALSGSQGIDDGNGGTFIPEILRMEVSTYQDGSENSSIDIRKIENGQMNSIRVDYNYLNNLPRQGYNYNADNLIYNLGPAGTNQNVGILELFGSVERNDGNGNLYVPSLAVLRVDEDINNGTEWGTFTMGDNTGGTSASISTYPTSAVIDLNAGNSAGEITGTVTSGWSNDNGYLQMIDKSNNGYNQLVSLGADKVYGANLILNGPTTNNYNFGTRTWEDADQPYMSLTGSQAISDGNGGTYIPETIAITSTTYGDGSENGLINFTRIENGQTKVMGLDYTALNSLMNPENFRLNDSNGNQLVSITTPDDGNGLEFGSISLTSTVNGDYIDLYGDGFADFSADITAANFYQSSDSRLKKNVTTLTSGLATINKLRGVRYNWKDENKPGNKIGFIAQEVEEVLPELVVTKKDGFKAVNYAEMTAILVEAVKELTAQVQALKTENNTLKAEASKVEAMEERLAKIESLLLSNAKTANANHK